MINGESGPILDQMGSSGETSKPEVGPTKDWAALREQVRTTPHSETVEAFLRKSKDWLAQPKIGVPIEEWNSQVDAQVDKAEEFLTTFHSPNATINKEGKIFVKGNARPDFGEGTLTRLYIGADPRHGAEVFQALVEELDKQAALKDVDIALNMDELRLKNLAGNLIIIYEPLSRPEVLDRILQAYSSAKENSPDAFKLSGRQKESLMRQNLWQLKATVDAGMSFVEIAAEDKGRSYDAGLAGETREALGLIGNQKSTEEEWLSKLKKAEARGTAVMTNFDREAFEKGKLNPGDIIHFKRKGSSPALIQYSETTKQ